MLEKERQMYQALAEEFQLKPDWMAELIDGQRTAGPELAQALAVKTDTKPRTWTAEGQGKVRQVAVRPWGMKQGRLAMVDVSEARDFGPTEAGRK